MKRELAKPRDRGLASWRTDTRLAPTSPASNTEALSHQKSGLPSPIASIFAQRVWHPRSWKAGPRARVWLTPCK